MIDQEEIKNYVINDIISCLKYELLDRIDEDIDDLPILSNVLDIIKYMNNRYRSYTLRDLDDKLFNELMSEVMTALQ